MNCNSESASHYAGCACNEEHWQDQVARLTRERDEARERAAGLSRELLDAMQARDSYRASADLRFGMRREFEALLGCGDTTGEEAFERGLIRLRALVAAEKELAEFSEILSRHNHEWSERCELAEARAERLQFQIEREIVFLEEEAATGVSFYEATFTQRAQALRAALGEEGK